MSEIMCFADIRVKHYLPFYEYSQKWYMTQRVTGIFVSGILSPPSMASFSDNLKRLRAECDGGQGITQVELSRRSGLTQSAISRYETGEDVPELASLLKLATGLELPLEPLVEGLDVRFDAVYRGLRLTMTDEHGDDDVGAEGRPTPTNVSITDIMPGAPTPTSGGGRESSPPDLAETHAELSRLVSELMALSARIAPGPPAVARDVGSPVRARDVHRRQGTRPKNPPRSAQKRR